MGFSALGLVLSLAVLAPNLLLLRFPPRPAVKAVRVPRAFSFFERAGQALCLVVPVITEAGTVRWGWLVLVGVLVVAYWALWVRYLVSGPRWSMLFAPVVGVPVPMALLPVAAFLASSVWLSNPWIAGAAAVLAAGHIPVSVLTARAG